MFQTIENGVIMGKTWKTWDYGAFRGIYLLICGIQIFYERFRFL